MDLAWTEILAVVAIRARGQEPIETRRGLPGCPDDSHSHFIEAAIDRLNINSLSLAALPDGGGTDDPPISQLGS